MIPVYYPLWDSSTMVIPLRLLSTHTRTLTLSSSLHFPLYTGYKSHLYFWDIFTFLRSICLSVIIVFLDSSSIDGNYQQGLAALLVFLCSTGLHFISLPYVSEELNYLEGVGLIVSMMTLYLGLWTFSISSDAASVIASVLIFSINGVWILCVLAVLFTSFGNKAKWVAGLVMRKVMCCCKKTGDGERKGEYPHATLEMEMGELP